MQTALRVFPDTSVCFPISMLDLILRSDEAGLHRVVWTEDLLTELERVWVGHGARSSASARRVCDEIRHAFAGQDVQRHRYEHLIASMPGPDPDDHPHAAAATAMAPSTLLTVNVKHFPPASLADRGVLVAHP